MNYHGVFRMSDLIGFELVFSFVKLDLSTLTRLGGLALFYADVKDVFTPRGGFFDGFRKIDNAFTTDKEYFITRIY